MTVLTILITAGLSMIIGGLLLKLKEERNRTNAARVRGDLYKKAFRNALSSRYNSEPVWHLNQEFYNN